MNRKGFTLVELLAVVALLGVIGGIATMGVLSTINKSKEKSEAIFVDKISTLIEEYLDLNRGDLEYMNMDPETSGYSFDKCENKDCSKSYGATAKELVKKDGHSYVTIQDLITTGLIGEADLVNPKNKEKCFNNSVENYNIRVFRDDEYVYYYYVDLSSNTCNLSEDNSKINTLPESLATKVGLSWKK